MEFKWGGAGRESRRESGESWGAKLSGRGSVAVEMIENGGLHRFLGVTRFRTA